MMTADEIRASVEREKQIDRIEHKIDRIERNIDRMEPDCGDTRLWIILWLVMLLFFRGCQ